MLKNELVKNELELKFILPAFTDQFVDHVIDVYMNELEYNTDTLLEPGDFEEAERESWPDNDSFIDIITSLSLYGDVIENIDIPHDEDLSNFFEACAGNFRPYIEDVYRVFDHYKMSYEMGGIVHSPICEVW